MFSNPKALRPRRALLLAGLTAAAAGVVSPMAYSSHGSDSITGSGKTGTSNTDFTISALSGPKGQKPQGSVALLNSTDYGDESGAVVCLNVLDPKQAVVGYRIDSSSDPSRIGYYRELLVYDGGIGAPDGLRRSGLRTRDGGAYPKLDCKPDFAPLTSNVSEGGVGVHNS